MQALVSNRLEELAECLCESIANLPQFARITVIVPSPLMGAWLEQFLAKKRSSGTMGVEIRQLSRKSILKSLLELSSTCTTEPEFFRAIYPTLASLPPTGCSFDHCIAFGWGAISPVYFEYFKSLPDCLLLLFSPCMLFWSDLLSQSEETYLLRRLTRLKLALPVRKRLDELLADKHPFLANTGVLTRTFLDMLDEAGVVFHERYVLQEAFTEIHPYIDLVREEALFTTTSEPISLLNRIQADMLLLVSGPCEETFEPDGSVQIIEAATQGMEVVGVKQALQSLLTDSPIRPGSILIVAPLISDYRAAIGRVFGEGDNTIPYQIVDSFEAENDVLVKQFYILLELTHQRIDKEQIELLLNNKILQFSQEEKQQLLILLHSQGFDFGINPQHKNQLLRTQGFLPKHTPRGRTLKEIAERLISDHQESPQLLRLLYFLEMCYEHVRTLSTTFQTFFEQSVQLFDFSFQDDGSKGYEELWKALHTSEIQEHDVPIAESRFHAILKTHIRVHFEKSTACQIWAPIVCTSLKSTLPPADVVCILGQEVGAFPNVDIEKEWSALSQYSKQYSNKAHFDSALLGRKSFLEAIFAARKALIVSHRNYSFERRTEIASSVVVREFKESLVSRYGEDLVKKCIKHQPFVTMPCKIDTRLREDFPLIQKSQRENLCGQFVDISIEELFKLARNPIQEFMKRRFGVVADWDTPDDILLPRRDVVQSVKMQIEGKEEKRIKLYNGYVQQLFEKEVSYFKEQMPQEVPLFLSLVPSTNTPSASSTEIILPPFISSQGSHRLIGSGLSLFPSAHLFWAADVDSELVRRRPEVVLRALAQSHSPIALKMKLFSVASGSEQELAVLDPSECLNSWLEYCTEAQNTFLPLIPSVVQASTNKKLDKEILLHLIRADLDQSPIQYSESVKYSLMELTQGVSIDSIHTWVERLYG